ncbi:MAG: hypothetical protein ABSC42_04185 [Tepidisphaeraceae bacterium]|jgi:hypothetical protein
MTNYFLYMLLFLFARYLHIVCATVLIGGTLFYEMVVPPAIDELKQEQQLFIFARARWFFKWIVWVCAALILISGVIGTYGHWAEYNQESAYHLPPTGLGQAQTIPLAPMARPGWWWAAHASCGILAMIIAVSLTIGKVPPSQPIRWMRLNLVILLLVMFLATATRQTRLEAGSVNHPTASPGESTETIPR